MKKIFTFAAAVLASMTMMAGDPTTTLDVEEAVGSNPSVSYDLDANGPKSWTWFGYNNTGSGSQDGFMDKTSRWKINSSRTVSFKIQNCDSVAMNAYFLKDATTSVKYAIGSDAAVEFLTNGTDKKCEKVGGFKTNTADEIVITISSSNDLLLGTLTLFPATSSTSEPVINVDKDSISLTATAAHPSASTTVKFTGKNLAPGTYDFNLPGLGSYFTVSPEYVTVELDGKLNQEVTVTFHEATEEIIWFEDIDTEFSLTISGITKTVKLHGINDMEVNYATSLNIEQLVLDNGKGADIAAALEAAHIEYANIDALDSLNDDPSKTARNYAYLGLKMKKSVDTKIGFWLAWHSTLNVRFGNVPGDVTVTINTYNSSTIAKADIANTAVEDTKAYSFTATEGDAYIEFTSNNSKALVFKQIMIDEEIAAVVLPAKPGDETGINNTEAGVKAIKRIVEGQLVIEKNGVLYNAQGAVVK